MQLLSRFRLQALFCALAVLCCALAGRPYADMGICDDGPYILMARHLAETGHVAYNGWSAAMLGWQLYLGAAFIKLFGYSFTTVRMSTLLVAMATAWLLQRTMVLAGVTERNATLGTLAFVLSPLYLMLGVTYMNDIFGLFAVVICLYGCVRALLARTDRSAILWLCFAVVTNDLFGTARQIAWLGVLVMVPSALFLLGRQSLPGERGCAAPRGPLVDRRGTILAGAAVTLAGAGFVFACMQWLKRQPYSIPEHLSVQRGGEFHAISQLFHAFWEAPFLLLALMLLFLPELRRDARRTIKVGLLASLALGLVLAVLRLGHGDIRPLLDPCIWNWVTKYGGYLALMGRGSPPLFLNRAARLVLTIASIGGLLGFLVALARPGDGTSTGGDRSELPLRQLATLVAPFAIAYALILIPRASSRYGVTDRYLLEPLAVALPWVVRLYQDRVRARMPPVTLVLVAMTAIYGIIMVHNMFSLYRARVRLAAELRAHGVPDTSVDGGWEYNLLVELRHSNHINDKHIEVPAHAFVPVRPLPAGSCGAWGLDRTPSVRPIYGVSFDPNACYGPARFAPVHYSRWPYREPGTLYVVRYLPPGKLSH